MLQIITAVITFLCLDAVWLGWLGTHFYKVEIGSLMRMNNGVITPLWSAAVVVYIALILGILLFVVPKADGRPIMALIWGAIFGFVTYATYDFTCLSTLAGWTWRISLIDTVWGMVLCGFTSFVTVGIARLFQNS